MHEAKIEETETGLQPADDGLRADAFLPATVAGATLEGQRWGTPLAAQAGNTARIRSSSSGS